MTEDVKAELMRMERGKWHPSALGGREGLASLFADDFVTVEYGSNPHGGVERIIGAKALMASPEADRLVEMLDSTSFELSQWHAVPAADDVVLLSYRVEAPSFGWKAYATSAWVRRDGRWLTLFYQASTAK